MTTVEIRPGTRDEIDTYAQTLSDAFAADPVYLWLDHNEVLLRRHLPNLFRYLLDYTFDVGGTVDVVGDGDAVMMGQDSWTVPHGEEEVERFEEGVRQSAGPCADRWLTFFRRAGEVHPMEVPHWYATFLGVRPELHGSGLGGTLYLACCKKSGLPAYCESTTDRSYALYQRIGFRKIGELHLGGGCPPMRMLWRDVTPDEASPA